MGRTYKPGRYKQLKQGEKMPNKAGAYRHRRKKTGKIDYHGESNNLRRRNNEHRRSGAPHANSRTHTVEYKVADGRSTSRTRREHERRKIKQHKPRYNQNRGGGGRKARNKRRGGGSP